MLTPVPEQHQPHYQCLPMLCILSATFLIFLPVTVSVLCQNDPVLFLLLYFLCFQIPNCVFVALSVCVNLVWMVYF